MTCVMTFDLGGTSLKAALVDEKGQGLAYAAKPCSLTSDSRGRSEEDPEKWWQKALNLASILIDNNQDQTIEAIAVTGFTRTQVFIDHRGHATRKAITWADSRADSCLEEINSLLKGLDEKSLPKDPINAFHPLARLYWVKKYDPKAWENTYFVLEPKDYLNHKLCGMAKADHISNSRLMAGKSLKPAFDVFDQLGLGEKWLAPLGWPWEKVGQVKNNLPKPFDQLKGIPVFCSGMDAWCGALGMGAIRPSMAYNVSGTSEVFGITTESNHHLKGLVTLPWGDGLYQIGGPSQVGADSLAWFAQVFLNDSTKDAPAKALRLLENQTRQKAPIVFLPYLRGERTPLWEPLARGLFMGINRDHRAVDFIWSILEGVAMANRQVFDLASRGQRQSFKEIRISGGASASDAWCRVKADVLGVKVVKTHTRQTGLLGAAISAYFGLGRFNSLEEAQKAMVRKKTEFIPDPEKTKAYDQLFRNWLEIQKQSIAPSRSLASMDLWQDAK